MAARLTRRKMATHIAEKIVSGTSASAAVKTTAAYLVEAGRTRELELLVRDIEDVLSEMGVVVATITTASSLTDAMRSEVRSVIGKNAQLRETVDSSVLGGIKIDLPGRQYDGTIRRKLTALRAKQL